MKWIEIYKKMSNYYKNFAVIVLNFVLMVLLIESIAYILLYIDDNYFDNIGVIPGYKNYTWTKILYKEMRSSGKVKTEPYLMYRLTGYNGVTINVSEEGIRKTYYSRCDSNNSVKIFIFGGSTTYGHGVPDWYTIPSLLAKKLNENNEKQYCVINYGQLGYVSFQEVILLINEIKKGNIPDYVIFYDGVNEVFMAYRSGTAEYPEYFDKYRLMLDSGLLGALYVSFYNSKSARILDYILKKISSNKIGVYYSWELLDQHYTNESFNKLSFDIINSYITNVNIVRDLAIRYNFTPIFIWQPSLLNGHKNMTIYEKDIYNRWESNIKLLTLACESKIKSYKGIYYIGDIFENVSETVYWDQAHLNPTGNIIVANQIYKIFKEVEKR